MDTDAKIRDIYSESKELLQYFQQLVQNLIKITEINNRLECLKCTKIKTYS